MSGNLESTLLPLSFPVSSRKKKGSTANLFILLPTRSARLIMISQPPILKKTAYGFPCQRPKFKRYLIPIPLIRWSI